MEELEAQMKAGTVAKRNYVGTLKVEFHKARFLPGKPISTVNLLVPNGVFLLAEDAKCFIRVSFPECEGEKQFQTEAVQASGDLAGQAFTFHPLKLDGQATVSIIKETEVCV